MGDGAAKPGPGREVRIDMDRVLIAREACEGIEIGLRQAAFEDGHLSHFTASGRGRRCFWTLPAAVRGKSSAKMT